MYTRVFLLMLVVGIYADTMDQGPTETPMGVSVCYPWERVELHFILTDQVSRQRAAAATLHQTIFSVKG
ncbi:hypothetical protein J4Q44_G00062410 [Coregonus suidteri]|uniref:Secreted protein n=1 Tax=Coregonus suidteri TaxID=861788 RepID=A0AAN8RE07_9TELE